MPTVIAGRVVTILSIDDRDFNKKLNQSSKSLGKMPKGFDKVKKSGVATFAAIGASVVAVKKAFDFAKESLEAFNKQQKAVAKLNAVLKATGRAAGFTSKQLQEQARDLQQITTFGDETIINMQALLATFKQINGVNFQRAQKAILDMSAVLDQDLKSGAIQVGKALNDPVKGITALSRVGVSFTQVQKDMIKSFMEGNNIAQAQAVILKELEGEFGGASEAMAKTFGGQMSQMKNAWGDFKEELGGAIAITLKETGFADALKNIIEQLTQSLKNFKQFVQTPGGRAVAAGGVGAGGIIGSILAARGLEKAAGKIAPKFMTKQISKNVSVILPAEMSRLATVMAGLKVGVGNLASMFTKLGNLIMSGGPVTLALAGLVAIFAGLAALNKEAKDMGMDQSLVNTFKEVLENIPLIGIAFEKLFDGIGASIGLLTGLMSDFNNEVIKPIAKSETAQNVKKFGTAVQDHFLNILTGGQMRDLIFQENVENKGLSQQQRESMRKTKANKKIRRKRIFEQSQNIVYGGEDLDVILNRTLEKSKRIKRERELKEQRELTREFNRLPSRPSSDFGTIGFGDVGPTIRKMEKKERVSGLSKTLKELLKERKELKRNRREERQAENRERAHWLAPAMKKGSLEAHKSLVQKPPAQNPQKAIEKNTKNIEMIMRKLQKNGVKTDIQLANI